MCEYCFYPSDFILPTGMRVCGGCFRELFCSLCWQHQEVVGERVLRNGFMLCATCVNNVPPIEIIDPDEIMNADMEDTDDENYYNIEELHEPPADFDINTASVVEHNPGYVDYLVSTQVEFEGDWYFSLDGQIYTVPYEIEIDDDYVRRDIVDNWDDVRWVGSIFGEYIAWY